MKILKKLLFPITALAAFTGTCHPMEKQPITYKGPTQTFCQEHFKISAHAGKTEIGYLTYYLTKEKAEIALLTVHKKYRNDQKERVGQHLFQACVNDVVAHNYKELEWTANPISDVTIDSICTIYEKMVKKLEHADLYQLVKGEEYGDHNPKVDMKLIFKQV